MTIDPTTLQQRDKLNYRSLPVTVIYLTRFWRPDKTGECLELICGDVWVQGRPAERKGIELIEFCSVAKRPRNGTI